jgi:hypothetical protein
MARVQVPEDQWREFRALAVWKKRSIAAYLGHLVQKEIGRSARVEQRRSLRQESEPEAPEAEVNETWVPPWEL